MSQTTPTTRRCYIHVGLPKSGTSYLQSVFRQSEDALAAHGLDLLPRGFQERRYLVVALRGRLDPATDPPGAFTVLERLRRQAERATGDRALISKEILGALTPDQIPPLLDALPGYEVHVVVTVRDLARVLPSGWQQENQALSTLTLHDFVDEFAVPDPVSMNKQRRRILQTVLDSWEHHVPRERVHVVTVPPRSAGPEVLLHRYCEVLGVDPTLIDPVAPRANTAIGVAQAELLRRVNVALGDRLSHPRGEYEEHAKDFLVKRVLRPQGGAPPRMPASARAWCTAASEAVIERLSSGGYHVVGDLDDLRPDPGSFTDAEELVSDAELVEVAAETIAAMLVERAADVAAQRPVGRTDA